MKKFFLMLSCCVLCLVLSGAALAAPKYVEVGYPVFAGMPVYPGLPQVALEPRERLDKGAPWNGSVLTMYLHAGTHVDAPWHMVADGPGIDKIPLNRFMFTSPLLLDVPSGPDHLITIDELKAAGGAALEKADIVFLNTGYWKLRGSDYEKYSNNFPTLSPEAAEFVRTQLPNCRAVAIDTLSIENIAAGMENSFRTHRTLLDPKKFKPEALSIYEDVNLEPIIGKKLKSAFGVPLRIVDHDASPVNVVVEIEE